MAEDRVAAELIERGDKLWSMRAGLDALWQELAEQYYPQRADFFSPMQWGTNYAENLFDDAPVVMRRDLANTVAAMLRPRARRWFKAALPDERQMKVQGNTDYLDHVADIMWRWMYRPGSLFVNSSKIADHDFVTFGNAVLSCEVNNALTGLVYRTWHLRDCAWLENADGVIDTMNRKIPNMTARQIKQRFGDKNLHADILEACQREPNKVFEMRHVMMPKEDFAYIDGVDMSKLRRRGADFVSLYIDVVHKEIVQQTPSFEFRYVVPRWQPIDGSPYAVSPATFDTLPLARKIQVMARTGNEALEKSVDPPSKAAFEKVVGGVNLHAGGITWWNSDYDERTGPALELFDKVGKNALLALQAIADERSRLADGTFVSKLNLPEMKHKEMTAFETQKRIEEYVRSAMPLVEPWEAGYSAAVLDETFGALRRLRAFDQAPDELGTQDFEWSFINPLQETAERMKAETYVQTLGLVGAAAKIDPEVVDDIDVREGLRDSMRGLETPAGWLRDKKVAEARSAEKRQAASLAQVVEGAGMAGEAARSVGEGMTRMQEAVSGVPA